MVVQKTDDLVLPITLKTPVVTLGPSGTDAEKVALQVDEDVLLMESFGVAMEHAYQNDLTALICCGYTQKVNGVVTDSWVDLNFRYTNKMRVVTTISTSTKPMCIAVRNGCKDPKSIIIHPATEVFLEKVKPFASDFEVHYVNNKPLAVDSVSKGLYDMCIGSLDVVEQYEDLDTLAVFQPQMVWALYEKCD